MNDGRPAQPHWLNDGEMRSWRAYVVARSKLEAQLHRELQQAHDLSLADYEVLVRLSEQEGRKMRMSELAEEVAYSKSRVSHQISRMELAGLVRRTQCAGDARGIYAEITDAGLDRLQLAAPTHVAGVRAHFVDLMTTQEQATIATVFEHVLTHLRDAR